MNTLSVFSVFDSKAEAFLLPFFVPNRAMALRSFTSAVQDESTDFHRYAGDYTLFELGEWDASAGEFAMHEAKINLGLASQYLSTPSVRGVA